MTRVQRPLSPCPLLCQRRTSSCSILSRRGRSSDCEVVPSLMSWVRLASETRRGWCRWPCPRTKGGKERKERKAEGSSARKRCCRVSEQMMREGGMSKRCRAQKLRRSLHRRSAARGFGGDLDVV